MTRIEGIIEQSNQLQLQCPNEKEKKEKKVKLFTTNRD